MDVKGKIALVDHRTLIEFINTVDEGRTDCLAHALEHGAIGMILAERTNPAPQYRCAYMGGFGDPDVIAGLPVFDCGRAEGDYLRSLCERQDTVRVKMKLDVPHAYKECQNVVGVLPGNGSINEILITYCHYDGCFTSALDNNAGIAFVLGLAKHFAAVPQESRNRDMWFTFLFGHDAGGNQGHRQFAAAHKDIMPRLIGFDIDHPVPGLRFDYVNGDMVPTGEDNLRMFGGTSFTLAEMARWVNYKHGLRSSIIIKLPWGNPNSRDFMAAGVPVAVTGMSFAWYYHTPEDKMEYIPLEQFERSFPADCEMLEMMSSTPEGYLIFNDVNLKRVVPNTPPHISLQVLSSTVLAGDNALAWIGQDVSDDRPLMACSIFPEHAGIVWDWGDGTQMGEGLFGVHAYQEPGTFTLTATITDYQGAKTSATHTFVVLAEPE